MKTQDNSHSYRKLASILLGVGVPVSVTGVVLMLVSTSSSNSSPEEVGIFILKTGIVLVLAALALAVTAAFKARQTLSKGVRLTLLVVLLMAAPITILLSILLFKL